MEAPRDVCCMGAVPVYGSRSCVASSQFLDVLTGRWMVTLRLNAGARVGMCAVRAGLVTVGKVRKRGYTLIEIAVTLLLMALVGAIGSAAYSSVIDSAKSGTSPTLLAIAQVEARRILANGGFTAYPATLATDIVLPGATTTSASSSAPNVVSVYVLDATTVVFAAGSTSGCLVLVDRIGERPTWVRDSNLNICAASLVGVAADAIAGGSPAEPVEAVFP